MTGRAMADVGCHILTTQKSDPLARSKRVWSATLLFSVMLGTVAGISGLGINALILVDIAENKGAISMAATWLLVAAFPLLFLSAHCLDRIDIVERMIRAEHCRELEVKTGDR